MDHLLDLSPTQALNWLVQSDADAFAAAMHGLLDDVATADRDPKRAVQALSLSSQLIMRAASDPALAMRLVEAASRTGDSVLTAKLGQRFLSTVPSEAGRNPEPTGRLASMTVSALLALGAYNESSLTSLIPHLPTARAVIPQSRPSHLRLGVLSGGNSKGREAILRQMAGVALSVFVYHVDTSLGADAVLRQMQADAIDLLIDISEGCADVARVIASRHPARAIILWNNSLLSPGVHPYNFIIVDDALVSKFERSTYQEKLLFLNDDIYSFVDAPELADFAQSSDHPSLGVICQLERISDQYIECWADLLSRQQDLRLVIVISGDYLEFRAMWLAHRMAAAGVSQDRVEFRRFSGDPAFDFAGIDVVLDSFPVGDPAACYRALRAGRPVVVLDGASPAGRASGTLLQKFGLAALTMPDVSAYAELALALVLATSEEKIDLRHTIFALSQGERPGSSPSLIVNINGLLHNIMCIIGDLPLLAVEDATKYLMKCDEAIFELAAKDLIARCLNGGNAKDKIWALEIATGTIDRLIHYPISVYNLIAALISVCDYETAGDIGYRAYRTATNRFVQEFFLSTALFALAGGTDDDASRIQELADALGQLKYAGQIAPRWRPSPVSGRKIRVGYIFSFFRSPAYSVHVKPVTQLYDRDQFDVYVYAVGPGDTDPTSLSTIVGLPLDQIRALGHVSDEEAARVIHQDGIDILVDLDGFSAIRRDGIFQRRPASINVLWYNGPYSLGDKLFDFVIADDIVIPPEEAKAYHEDILAMPHSVYSWTTQGELPAVAPSPCSQNHYITFGSYNRIDKLSSQCLASWRDILHRVPASRLILHYPNLANDDIRLWLTGRMHKIGVPVDRVQFRVGGPEYADWQYFMASYRDIDIALDPYPFNGGHTTFDALTMGVPLICYPGKRYAARVSASILAACDIPELVAPDRAAYIDLAVKLAQETPEMLTARRHDIRRRVLASPFMRWHDFVKALEERYKIMMQRAENWPDIL